MFDTGESTSRGLSLIDALNPETLPRDNTTSAIEFAREKMKSEWRSQECNGAKKVDELEQRVRAQIKKGYGEDSISRDSQ